MSTTASGEGYIDIKDDTLWSGDEELVPIDLSNTTARTFVVYKFGCFITDLLTIHCHHLPVTLLLAEKLPSNSELERNAYRNSFYYDANNRILYLRGERLDNVGEFVLVLVHCLSHIAAGDLRDDNNPVFLKEFHHALAVLCDDLFFARYRRSASLARTLTSRSAGSELETSDLFETVFGESHTESDKASVVDELLDENGLAHASTAEEADLAALRVRGQQVHNLDAGHEDFRFRRLLGEFRRGLVDRAGLFGVNRATLDRKSVV